MATRVGYCGGSTAEPTYDEIGDHTETVRLWFDPAIVTYDALLESFWAQHDPTRRCSKQYSSFVFTHGDEQHAAALKSLEAQRAQHTRPILTKVLPSPAFYLAEEYHQQYLRKNRAAW